MMRCLSVLLVAALLAVPAVAQGDAAKAGPGTMLAGPVDLLALTGGNGHLGVQVVENVGFPMEFLVSGRGQGAVATAPHSLYSFAPPALGTTASVLLNTNLQPTATSAGAWGIRDMAADVPTPGVNQTIFGGDETNIHAIDSLSFAEITGNIVIQAANGPVISTAAWPLSAAAVAGGTVRSLAFNPNGNGGNGSFWTANFGSAMIEFDIDGNVLTNWPLNGGWSQYGLAYDSQTGMLWTSTIPNAGDLGEIDPNTGLVTGNTIRRDTSAAVQGGLDIVEGFNALATYGVPSALVCLSQTTNDSIEVYRLHLYSNLNAGDEPSMLAEFSAQGQTVTGNRTRNGGSFTVPSEFQLELAANGIGLVGAPALVLFNLLGDATATGNTLGIPEFISVNAFSVPAATPGLTYTIGDGFGLNGLAAPNILGPGPGLLPATGTTTIPFPSPNLVTPGAGMRFQGLVFEPGAPQALIATNVVDVTFASPLNLCPPNGALVEANGANNFPGSAAAGYWTITNTNAAGGPSIVSASLDMFSSSNVAWAAGGGNFDYDQPMVNATEMFVNGNSGMAAICTGTYRGGSEVTTGLVFDVLNSFGAGAAIGPVACDPAAFCGWDTTNDLGGACTDKNFRFNTFGPGTVFNWDCDTDGGTGITGGSMAGIVVTLFWSDGCVTQGELAADPADPNRAFINL